MDDAAAETLRYVRSKPARRSIPRTTAVIPRLQRLGASAHQVERFERIDHLLAGALVEVEMLAPQSQAKLAGEDSCLIAHPRGIPRLALVHVLIKHGTGHFAVMCPRAPVEVVRTDHRPYVVYDDHLGVHIYRCAGVVFDVVDSGSGPGRRPGIPLSLALVRPSSATALARLCPGIEGLRLSRADRAGRARHQQ